MGQDLQPTLRALALGLTLLAACSTAGESRAETLYDLTFGLPHAPTFPAVEGAGPTPRRVVSPALDTMPIVVAVHGALTDQPLELVATDTGSPFDDQQFDLRLDDLPAAELYSIDADVLVTAGELNASITLLIDAPAVRAIDFQADGEIWGWASGGSIFSLGSFTLGEVVHLRVDVDLEVDSWSIWIDGVLTAVEDFESASSITTVRMGTDVSVLGPSISGAVDNLVISIPDEGPCSRVRFNDLTLGDQWVEGESFVSDDVRVDVSEFYFDVGPCGGASSSGFTKVVGTALACAGGKELEVNNVTLDFDFHGPVTDVLIRYGEYGGEVSLGVNGACEVVVDMNDLSGAVLGGVLVTVFDDDLAADGCGVIRLGGEVTQLSIGGQELFIDQISYCPACVDLKRSAFEDQAMGDQFFVGETFSSGAATHNFRRFSPPGADCSVLVANGVATIDSGDAACQDGLELGLNNINDQITFDQEITWLALAYGEFGGNINLRINGECRNAGNFAELSGDLIGGVLVWAVDYSDPGQGCGTLYAVGAIEEFTIGGQELWIDNVRTCLDATTGLEEGVPESLVAASRLARLRQSVPNPARSGAEIRFDLARSAPVALSIHDVAGRLVRELVVGRFEAGSHRVSWDGRDASGQPVAAGVYLYRIDAEGATETRRMVVVN